MQEYLHKIISSSQKGLYICELPTGYGKSYAVINEISKLLKSGFSDRKIIYLTTMIKNLPYDTLISTLDEKEKKSVLLLKSNFNQITEVLPKLNIPEQFRTEKYYKLSEAINYFISIKNNKINDKKYLQQCKDDISVREKAFRKEISRTLSETFSDKKKKVYAIHNYSDYKWIGTLYPAVFTDESKVLFMTVKKFLAKNSTIIEPSYDFLTSDMINNAIIFIDEFDATKSTVMEDIISNSTALQNEYIKLFTQIKKSFTPDNFSDDLQKSCQNANHNHFLSGLIDEGNHLYNFYNLNLLYKTSENSVDTQRNFLFHDGNFQSILQKNKAYIRTAVNNSANRVEINFENKKDFYKHRKESDLSIYSMLRDIRAFLNKFRIFIYAWAYEYQQLVNSKRNPDADRMTLESAISTILSSLVTEDNQIQLFLSEKCELFHYSYNFNSIYDFYSDGIEIFEFEDSDSHNENTNLQFISIFDTPEKILRFLSEKATVFGISATAEVNSVITNYNLSYLKSALKSLYHPMDKELSERVSLKMQTYRNYYKNGDIKLHTEVLKILPEQDTEEFCREFISDNDLLQIAVNLIKTSSVNEYIQKRYCKLLRVMCEFYKAKNINSLLAFEMELPKLNNPSMDIDILNHLNKLASINASVEYDKNSLVILGGNDFEKQKEKLLKELSEGKKRFVISTYKTIGAGQNMQYTVKDKSGLIELTPYKNDNDMRHFKKDFDAVYLDNITHVIVNINSSEHITKDALIRMIFNVEELYHNGEINYKVKTNLIKQAFTAFNYPLSYLANPLYSAKSVRAAISGIVIQAVGRICRTFLKNPDIYIFISEDVLENIDSYELKRQISSPETDAIVRAKESLCETPSDEENIILNTAERISSLGFWAIRRILSQNWTEQSIALWEELRQVLLTYPTADEKVFSENDIINTYFITLGKPMNSYIYSQYSDFMDITLSLTEDETEFRNSNRVKLKGNSDSPAVWKMSEEESGLPVILKYNGMKEYFLENNYALSFEKNKYLMSPIMFHNIYKGILGETAGSFILKQERNIELHHITSPEIYEFFDFILKPDVYVDFKNWKFTYIKDRDEVRKDILKKLDAIGGKRAYIINIIAKPDANYFISNDERIIEIPGLIDENGKIIPKSLDLIKEEDYR